MRAFIVFEGGEATGKSTQARLLAERIGAVLTHEPGGTDVGLMIRRIVLDPATVRLDARAEALLMAADKAQHVADLVQPALDAGRIVVCDRYVASSIVYQGFGRGVDVAELGQLLRFATRDLEPDLTLLLEAPDQVVDERLGHERDRFESESAEFHARVRAGYRSLAEADAARWAIVDASGPVEEVAARVASVVSQRLGLA